MAEALEEASMEDSSEFPELRSRNKRGLDESTESGDLAKKTNTGTPSPVKNEVEEQFNKVMIAFKTLTT